MMIPDATDIKAASEIERTDAAVDQGTRAAAAAGDAYGQRVAGHDERGEKNERAEGSHRELPSVARGGCGVYFDGHFAITPLGVTMNSPSG